MGIYAVKPRFRRLLRGTARALAARGATPDQVTSAGVVASGLGALALGAGRRWRGAFVAVPALALGALAAADPWSRGPTATVTPMASSTPPGPERCRTTRWPSRCSGRSPGGWP
jgi:hypothetical protein